MRTVTILKPRSPITSVEGAHPTHCVRQLDVLNREIRPVDGVIYRWLGHLCLVGFPDVKHGVVVQLYMAWEGQRRAAPCVDPAKHGQVKLDPFGHIFGRAIDGAGRAEWVNRPTTVR